MKRKINATDEEEARLSQLLFHKSKKFSEKLNLENELVLETDLKPAWVDEDDHASFTKTNSEAVYTEKLKQKYETLMGVPNWAKLTNQVKKENDDDEILRTVGHLQKRHTKALKANILETKKMPKINDDTRAEGKIISCIEFHPKLSVALVAGNSGVVSLFSIGGDSNKLHNFKLKNWKISTAHFSANGMEAFISSTTGHQYCIYDLVQSKPKLVDLPHRVKRPMIFVMSGDGKYIATCDGFDEICLISATSAELLKVFKHNTSVISAAFSNDSQHLYCYGVQGEVTVWDMSTYRSIRKFYDNGCVSASCITTSPCGRLLATGSGEGIINIYDISKLNETAIYEPQPYKTISNLTTKITDLKFNSSSEILAATSGYMPNAVKLIHIPSYNVFKNFPDPAFHVGQVDVVNFSPNSGYMALGNNNSCAYLYRLKHFKNY